MSAIVGAMVKFKCIALNSTHSVCMCIISFVAGKFNFNNNIQIHRLINDCKVWGNSVNTVF